MVEQEVWVSKEDPWLKILSMVLFMLVGLQTRRLVFTLCKLENVLVKALIQRTVSFCPFLTGGGISPSPKGDGLLATDL